MRRASAADTIISGAEPAFFPPLSSALGVVGAAGCNSDRFYGKKSCDREITNQELSQTFVDAAGAAPPVVCADASMAMASTKRDSTTIERII